MSLGLLDARLQHHQSASFLFNTHTQDFLTLSKATYNIFFFNVRNYTENYAITYLAYLTTEWRALFLIPRYNNLYM